MIRKIPDTITEAELKQLIAKAKTKKIKSILAISFYQCLRVSEILSLSKSNINIQTGFIHIKEGKGCKDRDIPIMEPSKFYFRYLPIKMTRQGVWKAIRKLGKEVLHKNIHPHTLRHSGASIYLNEKDIDLRFIQQLLGHERISTTQIYLHVNPTQLKNAFANAWR